MSDQNEMFEEEERMTVTLEYEDGTEEECIVMDIFSVEELGEQEYIALLSIPGGLDQDIEDDEIEAEIMLLRYEELEDGELNLEGIEDEQEAEIVQQAYEALVEEESEDEE